MASPPNTKSTPASPPAQESPFSSYVSSLSPINQVSGQNNVLADLTVPSPQPVFTSPHINFPRKGNSLRRFQKLGFSGAEKLPLFAIEDAICSEDAYICGSSLLRSTNPLSSCTQECNRFGASQDHSSSSPPTFVDEFLADSMQVCDRHAEGSQVIQGDCANYNEEKRDGQKEKLPYLQPSHWSGSVSKSMDTSVDDPEMKVTSDLPQVSHKNTTGAKEITTETHAPDVNKDKRVDTHFNLASSHLAEGDLTSERSSIDANLTNNDKQLKTVVNTIYGQIAPVLPRVNMSVPCGGSISMNLTATSQNPVSSAICCHRIKDVHARMHVAQGCNCTPRLQSESLPNEYDNHQDISAAKPCAPAYSEIPYDQEEVAQHQRAMRKRLQFEGVENHNMTDWKANSLDFKNEGYKSESPGTIMDLHSASRAESVALRSNEQLNQLVSQSGNALCKLSLSSYRTSKSHIEALGKSTNVKGNSSTKVPTPSGIGLHLNTIGSATKKNVNMLCEEKDLEALVGTSDSDGHCKTFPDSNNSFSSRSTTPHPSAKPLPCLDKSKILATGKDQSQLLDNQDAKLPNSSSIHHSPLEAEPLNSSLQMKLIDRCMTPCTTQKSPSEDASRTHLSPKKKRKKPPENEGCKRCNCKRSKCLKLYCDCFAAGTFCSEDCACQECFNRAEYKEMVQETRQQIESRNPLAFAPKVVLHITEASKDTGDFKNITPTSARHKRGCNCKKSQCLKKYCECYQAGVGCSLGCRCEGCKNTFGMKGGSGEISDMGYKLLQEIKDKQLVEGDCESDSSCEKSRVEAQTETLIAKQGLACLSPLTPFQGSVKNDSPESQIPVSYYQSPESGPSALLSYTVSPSCPWGSISNKSYCKAREEEEAPALGHSLEPFSAAKTDSFSPRWDGFPDICDFSPLSNISPHAGGGSFEAQTRERKILQMKLFEGSGHLSAGLLSRSSPVTPLPKFVASKPIKEPDSDSGLHYTTEDDTPDVLKDSDSPVKAVTASSPNQKRVSPPAKCLRESGSSSSPAMKGGRKFILKSVPSFPSLTP